MALLTADGRTRVVMGWVAAGVLSSVTIAAEPTRVLVLHSYHAGFSWTDSVQRGIERQLDESGLPVDLAVEYMDAKRYSGQRLFGTLATLYAVKYTHWKPSLVISCDDDALRFLFEYRERLFPGVPVVFGGLEVDDYDPVLLAGRSGYTGVVERLDLDSTIQLILELQPEVERIAFVHDRTTAGLANRASIEALAPQYAARVAFAFPDRGAGLTVDELLSYLRGLDDTTAVHFLNFFRDRNERPLAQAYIIPQVSAAAAVPVYTHAEAYLGYGVLGGKVLSGEVHGRSTAAKALRLLAGTPIDKVPVTVESSNRYMFDDRQLRRFSIPASRLPAGSIVAFQPTSFLERHRTAVLWGLAGVAALGVFSLLLVADIVRRRRFARRLAASEARHRLMAEHVTDMISKHGPDAVYTYASPACRSLLGYEPDELLGCSAFDFFHPDDIEAVQDSFDTIRERDITYTVAHRIRRKDGRYVWVETTSRVVRHPETGEIEEIIAVTRDTTVRKRAEEALRESEVRYRDLFEKNQAVKLVIDPHDGAIVDASPGAAVYYGYARETLRAMRITDINMAAAPTVQMEMGRAEAESQGYFEFQHRLASGEIRDVEVHSSPFTSGGRRLLYSIIHDITERKRAREALERERTFVQAILDTDPNVIFVKDAGGRFVLVNQACADLFETTPAALVGRRNVEVLTDPSEDEGYGAVDREVIRTGVPQTLEELHERMDGGQMWFLTTKARIAMPNGEFGVLGVCVDLTERKLAEEALRDNRRMLADAERLAQVGAWWWEIAEDRLELSENWLAIHGCREVPTTMEDLYPIAYPDDLPMIQAAFEQVLRGAGPYEMEHRIIRQDTGEVRYVRAYGTPTVGEDGTVVRVVGAGIDVTEQKQLEAQRRELEERMEQARRHESLATMAGAIAHNFNNILTAVLGNLELAGTTRHADDSAQEFLDEAKRAARAATELSRLMLVYVGRGQEKHRPFSMCDLLRDNRERVEQLVPSQVCVTWPEMDGKDAAVHGDRARLCEVLFNVVRNAVEAIGEDAGEVRVGLDTVELDAEALARSYIIEKPKPGRFVELTIADDGCGMDVEALRRLFEPYFSTKFMGRGLGLAVVLGIVRGHGGALLVESGEGKGTTMRILLPAVGEEDVGGDGVRREETPAAAG